MIDRLYRSANAVLRPVGIRIVRSLAPADRRRALMLDRQQIDLVLDVGGNEGQFGHRLRASGYHGAITSFEPLPQAFAVLAQAAARDGNWTAVQAAVGAEPGRLLLNVAGNSVSSSLMTMTGRHVAAAPESRSQHSVEVDVVTLDDYLPSGGSQRIYLKVDTQGYELNVLRGTGDRLAALGLIELELSLAELYDGQPLFREVDLWLAQQGFDIVSMEDGFWNRDTGDLLQLDAIYRRRQTS